MIGEHEPVSARREHVGDRGSDAPAAPVTRTGSRVKP